MPPALPSSLRVLRRNAYEVWAMRRTGGQPLVPPTRLHTVGDTDFLSTGDEFLKIFRELVDLRPSDKVLDVGCGIGRLARPLTGFLDSTGSYDGFDVSEVAIRWCQRHYAAGGHRNFRFRYVNVANGAYNPVGSVPAERFTFPYADASFDFIYLTSVFTHMMPAAVERYSQEVARVLAPGGRTLMTFFLLNEESRNLIAAGSSTQAFGPSTHPYAVVDPAAPEAAIAYEEPWVIELMRSCGLVPRQPPAYGGWCGRSQHVSYQDIVISDRPPAAAP